MDELVARLSAGEHPVALSRLDTPADLKECVEQGYVLVEFTGTRGGTELSVRLDPAATDLTAADLPGGTGTARLVGDLNLNEVDVRCIAEVEVATLRGSGRLEVIG